MLVHMLLVGFLAVVALLWLSIFGYILLLVGLAAWGVTRRSGRDTSAPATDELPEVAVLIATHNEEGFITAKLADLGRADYPADRLTALVVDRGSTDRTAALVAAARAGGAAVELLQVPDARGKAEQLNATCSRLHQEIVVVTDVDTALHPSCIRQLVQALLGDPSTAIAAARVQPATRLLEERIHWWLLNSLWWLEGEALGAAVMSGVCYAMRRSAMVALPADCVAEDIHFALLARARGDRVRVCRRAVATELRVPQTVREFLSFRRRRGTGYVRELLRVRPLGASPGWHLVRLVRLYHFLAMPVLAAGALAAALALCWTPYWHWVIAAAAAFAVPALVALFASTTLGADRRPWWHLGVAAGRLAGLTWLSLLALPRAEAPKLVQGE